VFTVYDGQIPLVELPETERLGKGEAAKTKQDELE